MLITAFSAQILPAIGVSALAVIGAFALNRSSTKREKLHQNEDIAFLFRNKTIVDATPLAHRLLESAKRRNSDFDTLIDLLDPYFDDLRTALTAVGRTREVSVQSVPGGKGTLFAEHWDGLTRVVLIANSNTAEHMAAQIAERVLRTENDQLRQLADDSPYIMWKTDKDQVITWANAAYLALHDKFYGGIPGWPPAHIFDNLPQPQNTTAPMTKRVQMQPPETDAPRWYDVSVQNSHGDMLFTAKDVTQEVQAKALEQELLSFLEHSLLNSRAAMCLFDCDKHAIRANAGFTQLVGARDDQLPNLDLAVSRLKSLGAVDETLGQGAMQIRTHRFPTGQVALMVDEAQNGAGYSGHWGVNSHGLPA